MHSLRRWRHCPSMLLTTCKIKKSKYREACGAADSEDRFECYSQTVHHYFPMIDGQRFQSHADDLPSQSELVSLRFAIWAHAAILDPRYSHLSDKFYLQARKYIEITEADAPNRFFTVPTLQTLILLALYEFKQTCFTRSWVSVGRATWLAHTLGLHKMDTSKSEAACKMSNILPWTDDAMEIEERRRTFWVMLQLNCLSTVGVCWNLGLGFDLDEVRKSCTLLFRAGVPGDKMRSGIVDDLRSCRFRPSSPSTIWTRVIPGMELLLEKHSSVLWRVSCVLCKERHWCPVSVYSRSRTSAKCTRSLRLMFLATTSGRIITTWTNF